MPRRLSPQSHVVVADSRPRDYRHLALLAGEFDWHVHLLTSGGATLQFARHSVADLWIVNCRLPDMSGFDLVEMLRDLPVCGVQFLVGNRYDADEERRACACGAGLYLCKDAKHELDCRGVLASLAGRGPPRAAPAGRLPRALN